MVEMNFSRSENNHERPSVELSTELGAGQEPEMQYELFDVEDEKFYRGKLKKNQKL